MIEEFMNEPSIEAPDSACKDFADDLDMSLENFKGELKERWEAQQ